MSPFLFLVLMYFRGIDSEEPSSCLYEQLDECINEIPPSLRGIRSNALPVNRREINALCRAYTKAMNCIETWSSRCLLTEMAILSEKQTVGVKQMMKLLCHDEAFTREYLNHTTCFRVISNDWEECLKELHTSTRLKSVRGRAPFYVDVRAELCCIREEFQHCIERAGRAKCPQASVAPLRRIAETLVQDGLLTPHCRRITCSTASIDVHSKLMVLVTIIIFHVTYSTLHKLN